MTENSSQQDQTLGRFRFGMRQQANWLSDHSKITQARSALLRSHLMTTSSSLALRTRPFDFGTQKLVNLSWLHSRGTQTRSIRSRSLTIENSLFQHHPTRPFASGPLNKYNNRSSRINRQLTAMDGSKGRTVSYCSGFLRAITSASADQTTPESLVRMKHSSTLRMRDGVKIGLNVTHHRITLIYHLYTDFFLCMYVSCITIIPRFSITSRSLYHIIL